MNKQQKEAIDFLLYCYFGVTHDPVAAAIDKGYVDMAAHTLKGFCNDEYEAKWKARFDASKLIRENLTVIPEDYDRWHRSLCQALTSAAPGSPYGGRLTYGQAQKWVNMTMKYLYVFFQIYSATGDRDKLRSIPSFFSAEANVKKLHVPLDSHILHALGCPCPWSSLSDPQQYKKCQTAAQEKGGFPWEMENWSTFAAEGKDAGPRSYSHYVRSRHENYDGTKP